MFGLSSFSEIPFGSLVVATDNNWNEVRDNAYSWTEVSDSASIWQTVSTNSNSWVEV